MTAHEQDDELEGCELNMAIDPVPTEGLLFYVFGEDEKKFEAYRQLFAEDA